MINHVILFTKYKPLGDNTTKGTHQVILQVGLAENTIHTVYPETPKNTRENFIHTQFQRARKREKKNIKFNLSVRLDFWVLIQIFDPQLGGF